MSKKNMIFLIAILAIGLLIRVFHLGFEGLWLDEAYTARLVQSSTEGIIKGAAADVYPPFFYLFLHSWTLVFGESEFSLRFPSVIFSLLTILVAWKMGEKNQEVSVGFIAAIMLTFSPFSIRYAQEARAYSLLAFTIVSSYLFILNFIQSPSKVNFLGFVLTSSIALWSHSIAVIFVGLQAAWVLLESLLSRKKAPFYLRLGAAYISVGLVYMPWLKIFLTQAKNVGSGEFWLGKPGFLQALEFIYYDAGSIVGFFILIFFLTLAVKSSQTLYMRGLWTLGILTPLIVWGISQFVPVLTMRNLLPALPAAILIAANALKRMHYKPLQLALSLVFIVGCANTLLSYYSNPQRDQWREAAKVLQANMKPGDGISYDVEYGRVGMDWYLKGAGITEDPKRVWKVFYHVDEDRIRSGIKDTSKVFQLYGITIVAPD